MKQIFHRLYLSIFYVSFIATVFAAYQTYEKFKIVHDSRQLITVRLNEINDKILNIPLPRTKLLIEKPPFDPNRYLLEQARDCYQTLVDKWEFSKLCEADESGYDYGNLIYNFDSYLLLLVLTMFIPLWIALAKKWIIWIAKGIT